MLRAAVLCIVLMLLAVTTATLTVAEQAALNALRLNCPGSFSAVNSTPCTCEHDSCGWAGVPGFGGFKCSGGTLVSVATVVDGTPNTWFCGTMPTELSVLSSLTTLNLDISVAGGTLPVEWAALGELAILNVQARGSAVSGTIPTQYANITKLRSFSLLNAPGVTGTLPGEYAAWSNPTSVTVSNTSVSGTLPAQWATWFNQASALQTLFLRENQFTGSLPSNWSTPFSLEFFSVAHNFLSGSIPQGFSASSWQYVYVEADGNNFDCPMPLPSESPEWNNGFSTLCAKCSLFAGYECPTDNLIFADVNIPEKFCLDSVLASHSRVTCVVSGSTATWQYSGSCDVSNSHCMNTSCTEFSPVVKDGYCGQINATHSMLCQCLTQGEAPQYHGNQPYKYRYGIPLPNFLTLIVLFVWLPLSLVFVLYCYAFAPHGLSISLCSIPNFAEVVREPSPLFSILIWLFLIISLCGVSALDKGLSINGALSPGAFFAIFFAALASTFLTFVQCHKWKKVMYQIGILAFLFALLLALTIPFATVTHQYKENKKVMHFGDACDHPYRYGGDKRFGNVSPKRCSEISLGWSHFLAGAILVVFAMFGQLGTSLVLYSAGNGQEPDSWLSEYTKIQTPKESDQLLHART